MVDRLVNSDANKRRIETVENCFGTFGSKLAIPGRVLVGEGILTKICRKKPKPRQFFLFNDVLVYGTILISKKKYNKQHLIPLEVVTLADIADAGDQKNGWLIKTPNKSFAVYAATPTEKVEWMAHINKCIDELIKRTGKRINDAHAAVWIPDSDTKYCMHCNKTQFTMINRRHHCRNCGRVTCANCSKNKFLIRTQSHKPLRVCDSCFNVLCRGRTSSVVNSESPSSEVCSDGAVKVPTKAIEEEAVNSEDAPEKPPRSNGSGVATTDDSSDDDEDSGLNPDDRSLEQLGDVVDDLELDNKPTFYSMSFSIADEASTEETQQPEVAAKEVKDTVVAEPLYQNIVKNDVGDESTPDSRSKARPGEEASDADGSTIVKEVANIGNSHRAAPSPPEVAPRLSKSDPAQEAPVAKESDNVNV